MRFIVVILVVLIVPALFILHQPSSNISEQAPVSNEEDESAFDGPSARLLESGQGSRLSVSPPLISQTELREFRGFIVDPQGRGISAVEVSLSRDGEEFDWIDSDLQGRFAFSEVMPSDSLTLRPEFRWQAPAEPFRVGQLQSQPGNDLVVFELEPKKLVKFFGRVVAGLEAQPLPRCRLEFVWQEDLHYGSPILAQSDERGFFQTEYAWPPGSYRLKFPDLGGGFEVFVPEEGGPLEIEAPSGTLFRLFSSSLPLSSKEELRASLWHAEANSNSLFLQGENHGRSIFRKQSAPVHFGEPAFVILSDKHVHGPKSRGSGPWVLRVYSPSGKWYGEAGLSEFSPGNRYDLDLDFKPTGTLKCRVQFSQVGASKFGVLRIRGPMEASEPRLYWYSLAAHNGTGRGATAGYRYLFPGTYRVAADGDDWIASAEIVSVQAGKEVQVNLKAKPRRPISEHYVAAEVRTDSRRALPGLVAVLSSAKRLEEPLVLKERVQWSQGEGGWVGRVEFRNLYPGSYRLVLLDASEKLFVVDPSFHQIQLPSKTRLFQVRDFMPRSEFLVRIIAPEGSALPEDFRLWILPQGHLERIWMKPGSHSLGTVPDHLSFTWGLVANGFQEVQSDDGAFHFRGKIKSADCLLKLAEHNSE
ncbi:MAG: hypothetical protein DWQ01_22250 [Planctomycetota bacterium]|nr:MAG: hypothetical protein DWQ01_22250 [Planctomycetota bacterium]